MLLTDSMQFDASLPSLFQKKHGDWQGSCPHFFSKSENDEYPDEILDESYVGAVNMDSEMHDNDDKPWHDDSQLQGKVWNFMDEFRKYCRTNVDV